MDMSIDTARTRQPAGAPTGGEFTTEQRPEPTGVNLAPAGDQVGGLYLVGDFTGTGRELAEMVARTGLVGTIVDNHSTSEGWTRLTATLASGDELNVGIAVTEDERATSGQRITAVVARFSPGDDGPDLGDAEDSRYGGTCSEPDVHEAVRHTLMQVAARAQFEQQFPDTQAQGMVLDFIGAEPVRSAFRRLDEARPEEIGARFTLDGAADVVASTFEGRLWVEADSKTLDARSPYLLALTTADLNRRLGVTPAPGQGHDAALGETLTGVIAAARSHPVWAQNIDETKAGLL